MPCQATAHDGEAERVLLEDVQECIAETVEIIQSYKNRNMVSRAFASPLCKRRLREAEEAIMSAVQRLQVGGWLGGGWITDQLFSLAD